MPRLLIAPTFPGFLEGSVPELRDFFFIRTESAVPVERFTIISDSACLEFPVEDGTYKTALFLLYMGIGTRDTNYVLDRDKQRQLPLYYGDGLVADARTHYTKHTALRMLLGDHVRVELFLKPGYRLPDCRGRTIEELICYGWERRDEMGTGTDVPLIRHALVNFLAAVQQHTIPVASTGNPNCWPSTLWVERARTPDGATRHLASDRRLNQGTQQ